MGSLNIYSSWGHNVRKSLRFPVGIRSTCLAEQNLASLPLVCQITYPATAISLSLDVTGTFASLARVRLVTLQVRKRNVKFFSLSLKENGETVRNDEFLRLKCLSLFKDSF